MKRLLLISALLLSLIPTRVLAKDFKLEKKLEHRAAATAASTLAISNKYGNVAIEAWDRNEVWITVTVTAESNRSEEDAKDMLDMTDVEFSNEGNTIKATTVLDTEVEKKTVSILGIVVASTTTSVNNSSRKINYKVFAPRNISFALQNKYGNISFDRCGGNADIELAYGNLQCNDMVGKSSNLSLAYGSANIINTDVLTGEFKYSPMIAIEKANTLNLTVGYSTLKLGTVASKLSLSSKYSSESIGNAASVTADLRYSKMFEATTIGSLTLTSSYSNIQLGTVKNLTHTSKYDNVKIAKVSTCKISSGYNSLDIDELLLSAEISKRYGSINIEKVNPKAESISIQSGYVNTTIGLSGTSYQLNASSRYGKINLSSKPEPSVTEKVVEGSSTSIKAHSGSGKPQLMVKIENQYGSVTLK